METEGVCKLKPEHEGPPWHRTETPHSAGRSSAEEVHNNTNWDQGKVFSLGWPGLLQG